MDYNVTTTFNLNSLSTDGTHDFLPSSVNFVFVSIDYCLTKNSSTYCNYSAFIILLGYITNAFIFPFILHRMHKLNTKFRNQYNVSLLWLCSIFLVFSIDIIEFLLINDGNLYSVSICVLQIIYLITLGLTIISYFRNYTIDGRFVRNLMTIMFTIIVFVVTFIGRYLSMKNLKEYPDLDQISPISFHIINTHFFLYFFIYVVFAIVQVYQNLKNKFARCLTNLSYAAWVLGSFMFSFYSEVLPKRPAYDFIHYRNYFLMSTIIVIMLQDINFIRIKLYQRKENLNINSISMKELNTDSFKSEKFNNERKFIEDAFNAESESTEKSESKMVNNNGDEDEETFFDIEEYNLKGSTIITVNDLEKNKTNDIQIRMKTRDSKLIEMQRIINNNQTRLILLFVIILVCELIYITVLLFKSVTFSHFALISPLIHPFIIIFSLIFKKAAFKM